MLAWLLIVGKVTGVSAIRLFSSTEGRRGREGGERERTKDEDAFSGDPR